MKKAAPAIRPGRLRSIRAEDQDALGSADGLSDGLSDGLDAGALDTGSLDTGVLETGVLDTGVLEIGFVVAAGVLHAMTAPPRLAASARASRIRFVIRENLRCRGRDLVRSHWALGRATRWDHTGRVATAMPADVALRLQPSRSGRRVRRASGGPRSAVQ